MFFQIITKKGQVLFLCNFFYATKSKVRSNRNTRGFVNEMIHDFFFMFRVHAINDYKNRYCEIFIATLTQHKKISANFNFLGRKPAADRRESVLTMPSRERLSDLCYVLV